ncbi:hypothetical protein Tco_1109451 [Tanacetum coccineum]
MRISIRDESPIPFWSNTEVARLLDIPTLPPSPLSPWSSPLPQIPLPPLPVSSPVPVISPSPPASPIRLLDAPSSGIPPLLTILLHTSSPPLHLLSTDRRADRPEVTLLPQKRLGIALGPRYEVGESSSSPNARPPGEAEARMSREDWGRSIDASDLARSEVMALRTQVVAHQAVITELQATDRMRKAAISELLAADHRRQAQFIEALKLLKRLQT